MRRVLLSSLLIFLSCQTLIFAQRDSLRNAWLDADSWFLLEEFAEALPLYQKLHANDQGNDNLNYKIGICLLNDPYQKDKAIQYLLDASENINPNYKENSMKERTAPPDALYHLGNAYQVNELLNHAIESYEEFLQVMDHNVYDEELVRAQIRSCKNAQRLKTMPVDIDLTLMDEIINTPYSDVRPVISGDGNKMAFVTKLPFYDGAFVTEKTDEGWSYPQIITQSLGFDEDIYPVCLSYDGTEMILYYDDDYIGNLYYSSYEDGLWLPAVKMGAYISTKYWESHACFSKDGQSLYFTSNRKGTHGGLDIYVSARQDNGSWGVPYNLGNTINSPYNEESPFISEDGRTLYFSSYGHYNIGGYDIFYSKKAADGTWSEPVNIGYPINTTDNDLYFQPINNGDAAYYSVYSPRGAGRHDIYYMNIYSVNNPRYYPVTGKLRTEDGSLDSTQMAIFVIDTDSGDTLVYTQPGQDGSFGFALKQGIYELHFTGEGYVELIRPLRITAESNKEGIQLAEDLSLELVKKDVVIFEGEESQIQLREKQYEGLAGEVLEVPVRVPRGSTLVLLTYQDYVQVGSETIKVDKRRTDLEIIPLPGTSEVHIELIDEDGNIHRNTITVIGTVPEAEDAGDAGEEIKEEGQIIDPTDPVVAGAAGLLLLQLQRDAEGELHDFLQGLDPGIEGIESERELLEYLYEQADPLAYQKNEVDAMLSGVLAHGDAELLKQLLTENSEGALKEYLLQLDLEAEGITNDGELLRHLEEVAEAEGFEMEDVRKAMLESLDHPLEVDRVYDEVLGSTRGDVNEILKKLDLRKEGIYTVEELIEYLYRNLAEKGMNSQEIEEILLDLFPYDGARIQELGEKYGKDASGKGKLVWPFIFLFAGVGAGLIWFIILWRRRRDKQKEQDY